MEPLERLAAGNLIFACIFNQLRGMVDGDRMGSLADKAAIITRALDSDMTQDDDPAIAKLNGTIASIDKRLGKLRNPTHGKQAKGRTERAEPELELDVIPF